MGGVGNGGVLGGGTMRTRLRYNNLDSLKSSKLDRRQASELSTYEIPITNTLRIPPYLSLLYLPYIWAYSTLLYSTLFSVLYIQSQSW